MTNWQAVRDGLATELMGWIKEFPPDDHPLTRAGFWTGPEREPLHATFWKPDENWAQCGQVIEAMRVQGWLITVGSDNERWLVAHWKLDSGCYAANGKTFPQAVTLAAARALGIEGIEENDEREESNKWG